MRTRNISPTESARKLLGGVTAVLYGRQLCCVHQVCTVLHCTQYEVCTKAGLWDAPWLCGTRHSRRIAKAAAPARVLSAIQDAQSPQFKIFQPLTTTIPAMLTLQHDEIVLDH